jgi:hypothetical protein
MSSSKDCVSFEQLQIAKSYTFIIKVNGKINKFVEE